MPRSIANRKESHIQVCLSKKVESEETAGFEDIHLIHRAVPEMDVEEVSTSTKLFRHSLSAPIVIEAITGGVPSAGKINGRLAEAAEKLGVAMGVGSQRIAIEDPSVEHTFKIVREKAPSAFIIANLGAAQMSMGYDVDEAKRAVDMISADALAIHFNPLHEAVQFQGDLRFKGVLSRLKEVAKAVKVPVIAKETGAGIAAEEALKLEQAGVAAVDIGGLGGTDWTKIEYYRAKKEGNRLYLAKTKTFSGWGIPTAASVIEVRKSTRLVVIASGGIRNGVHVAKSIALGAEAAGFALPLLKPAVRGVKEVEEKILATIDELRTAMFLTASKNIEELGKAPLVVNGRILNWVHQRGFDIESYAKRLPR